MKKLIIVRGHQGSGKTTFAKEKIKEYEAKYPGIKIFHMENDTIIKELGNGEYIWSPEILTKAINISKQRLKAFLKNIKKDDDVLVISSNVNAKIVHINELKGICKKFGITDVEVYRTMNHFENLHNVPKGNVVSVFISLNENPIKGEIIVPAVFSGDIETQEFFNSLNKEHEFILNSQNSYLSKEYLLKHGNKFVANRSTRYPDLTVFKYSRKAFWNKDFDKALLEMRGLVMDGEKIVIRPFKKVFNYGELRGLSKDLGVTTEFNLNEKILAVEKINGFLGCATYIAGFNNKDYNNKVLYSTTGSLDSSYVDLAKKHLEKYEQLFKSFPNHTFLFEIVDESDPHIIKEKIGAYLIGVKDVSSGLNFLEIELDQMAAKYNILRPKVIDGISIRNILDRVKDVKHEGFVVHDIKTEETLFKLKSPYYLITKFLARNKNLDKFLRNIQNAKKQVDEEYYPLIDYLSTIKDKLLKLDEQEKIAVIKEFLNR